MPGSTRLLVALTAAVLGSTGCVERWLHVRTDPPGAAVYLDGELAGRTPASGEPLAIPFQAYGTRVLVARSEGRTPVRRTVELDVPWYQYFPLDLVTEVFWPGTIRDVHPVRLVLSPRPPPGPAAALVRRARHFADSGERRP